MKTSAVKNKEILCDEEILKDTDGSHENGCHSQKQCSEEALAEKNLGPSDLSTKSNNVVNKEEGCLSDDFNKPSKESNAESKKETMRSESYAPKNGLMNGGQDNGAYDNSSSENEDSCDGLNNNKILQKQSSITDKEDGDHSDIETLSDAVTRCREDSYASSHSTNRRKGSSRKSQSVRKVVNMEPGDESDYYDSDLEEYMTPIKTAVEKKQDDSTEKRRKSKRKRKLHLNIDEDSDYFCIENFLNSNPDEQQSVPPPKEKKKKKKAEEEDPPAPSSPKTQNPTTKQNVKLNLPNGMTRVVSLEMPSPGSDSNSMLCSLLTGKRYSSPGKGKKLQLISGENSSSPPSNKDSDQVKRVRFSEQDAQYNLVPKTVDDHCAANKEDRNGGNVPLILENLLTSPHINKNSSVPGLPEVPTVVDNEVLDLSNSVQENKKQDHGSSSRDAFSNYTMQKSKHSSSRSHNLTKKPALDGASQVKGGSSDKGFSEALLSYLTSGKSSTESNDQPIDVDQQLEYGGIKIVLSGNKQRASTNGSPVILPANKAKENVGDMPKPVSAVSGKNMYYAKSEYIDLNELYCLQKGKRPIFEIEDSDDDNDVIIMGEGMLPKSASQFSSSARKSANLPSAAYQRNSLSNPSAIKAAPHPVLPDVSVLRESTINKHNKTAGQHSDKRSDKTAVNMNNGKQLPLPQVKESAEHSMKDGFIKSISFTVSKLDANSSPKPVQQLKSLIKPKLKGGNKKLSPPTQESPSPPTLDMKAKAHKVATSLIKPRSPTSSSQRDMGTKRVYNSLLTGNSYLMKNHSQAVPLAGKKATA